MNTPEHVTQVDVNENTEQYFDHSQTRLVHHHIRRVQGRDYGRILREYNTPAEWYKPPPTTRSIYYYDPIYQKYLQQQQHQATINHHPILAPIRVANQSKLRTKYTSTSFHSHSQKSAIPSRLQSVPRLPPIVPHKKPNNE